MRKVKVLSVSGNFIEMLAPDKPKNPMIYETVQTYQVGDELTFVNVDTDKIETHRIRQVDFKDDGGIYYRFDTLFREWKGNRNFRPGYLQEVLTMRIQVAKERKLKLN